MRLAPALLIALTPLIGAYCATPSFRAVEIDSKIEIGYGLAVADVDGDNKPDILLADARQYVWYQNPSWKKHVMTEKLTQRDHVCLTARDIDGDGKAEVAVGAEWNPGDTLKSGAIFFLKRPQDPTQKWEAIPIQPHEPTTHRMRWMRNWQDEFELVVAPLHGRGNKNGQGEGVKILAYKMGSSPGEWTTRAIDDSLHMTHNFDPIQWDDDSAEEPLIASKEGVFVVNWEDGALKRTQLSGNESGGAGEVRLGRLAGGKRFFATIEPMHGSNLVVYTEPGESGSRWDRHVVDSTLADGHALARADLAGTGADQIVVGWRAMGKPGVKVGIKMFSPDRDGKEWKPTLVDDNTMACEDLCVADLDGNGKLDIVAAGRATKNVKIYFNRAKETTSGK